jgi:hypothetical protein
MSAAIKYDDADYHYGDDVFSEKHLPLENGGTHIGFFLAWVLLNGMESDTLRKEATDAIEKVRAREMTGREFLFSFCDEKLLSVDLNSAANSFAQAYYDRYLGDFEAAFDSLAPSTYEVADNWANYDLIAQVISRRYQEYGSTEPQPGKKESRSWWQIWK